QSNAYYFEQRNKIFVLAPILLSPYNSKNEQDYIKYGFLGTTFGHEITHAFDYEGRYYDADGNKNNWWTDDDDKDFKEASQCFIDQYNAFSYKHNNKIYKIDGILTLNENIADNGGLARGYDAWQRSMLKDPQKAAQRNQKLPGLSEYTLDQLFYIAYGQSNCAILPEYERNDPHSFEAARVNVVLSNSKHFAKTFNCPLGSPMNPESKCILW
ncbi:hypothetical protein PIROE2DRAFT_12445, partial [Piromyces sp. E2]